MQQGIANLVGHVGGSQRLAHPEERVQATLSSQSPIAPVRVLVHHRLRGNDADERSTMEDGAKEVPPGVSNSDAGLDLPRSS